MKSVILTFLMFVIVFGALKLNFAVVFDGFWFPITAVIIFITILSVAIFMFGMPKKQDILKAFKIERKDVEDEKDK